MAFPVGTTRTLTCRSPQPNPGSQARDQIHHPPIDAGHTGIRIEHHRLSARCWPVTSCSAPCLMPPSMGAKKGILR